MTGQPVLSRSEGRVRILQFNRPEARNALNSRTREMLLEALAQAKDDDGVGAVVLTGVGSCFAAGADLRELLGRTSDDQRDAMAEPTVFSEVADFPKPVVVALNGHALGAGLELAMACDVRVCSSKAKLGQPEINLALIPGGGGTQRLVRLVGPGRAARMVMTGDPIDAATALAWGLVEEVVAPEEVEAAAVALATRMAEHDPVALAAAKQALRGAISLAAEDGFSAEVELFLQMHGRDAARERIGAFLER